MARGATLALVLGAATFGCGPVKHHVKLSMVPEAARVEVEPMKTKVESARDVYDEAKTTVKHSRGLLKEAETELKSERGQLKIAEEAVDMEQAREKAGEPAEVAAAKTRARNVKQLVKMARARVDVEASRRKHLDQLEAEMKAAWVLAIARYEVAKAAKVDSADPKWAEKKAKVEAQLEAKTEAYEREKARSSKTGGRLQKAEDKLVDAQG